MAQRLDPDMFDQICPSQLVPFRLGDKWAAMIIRCLERGPRRFSELKVPLRGITSKVLTRSLRALEQSGFVDRTVYSGPVRHVEYRLTDLGRSVLDPLNTVCEWTEEHWDELLDARDGSAAGAAEDVSFG